MTILIQNCTQQEINAALIRLQKTFKNEQAALEGKVGSIITNTINEKYDDSSLRSLVQNVKAELTNKINTFDERIATNTTNIARLESSLANIDVSYNETTNTLTFQNRFGYDTYFHLKDTTYTFTLDTSTNSLDITNDLDPLDTTHIPLGYRYGFTWNNGTLTITETYDGTTSTIATYNLDNRYYTEDEIDGLLADIVARITDIEDLIPPQATSSNQLADKDFVNSSIETATATFRGTFNSVADLEAYTGPKDNNDYAFVKILDPTSGIYEYDRYKYNGTEWVFEYTINSSGFTAAQLAALNSGITSSLVAKITDVYNPRICIYSNGTCCGSFTLNQSSTKCIGVCNDKVLHTNLETSNNRPLLFASASIESGSVCGVYYSAEIKANPATGTITALCFDGTSKDSTCFGGCTYEQAKADIQSGLLTDMRFDVYCGSTCKCTVCNGGSLCLGTLAFDSTDISDMATQTWVTSHGYCDHDCLVRLCGVCTCADRNILFTSYTNGCICPVYYSCKCPLTFNACTGRLSSNIFDATSYIRTPTILTPTALGIPSVSCNIVIRTCCTNASCTVTCRSFTFCGSTGYLHGNICGNLCGVALNANRLCYPTNAFSSSASYGIPIWSNTDNSGYRCQGRLTNLNVDLDSSGCTTLSATCFKGAVYDSNSCPYILKCEVDACNYQTQSITPVTINGSTQNTIQNVINTLDNTYPKKAYAFCCSAHNRYMYLGRLKTSSGSLYCASLTLYLLTCNDKTNKNYPFGTIQMDLSSGTGVTNFSIRGWSDIPLDSTCNTSPRIIVTQDSSTAYHCLWLDTSASVLRGKIQINQSKCFEDGDLSTCTTLSGDEVWNSLCCYGIEYIGSYVYKCALTNPSNTRRYVQIKTSVCRSCCGTTFRISDFGMDATLNLDSTVQYYCGNYYGGLQYSKCSYNCTNSNCFWLTYGSYRTPILCSAYPFTVLQTTTEAPAGVTFSCFCDIVTAGVSGIQNIDFNGSSFAVSGGTASLALNPELYYDDQTNLFCVTLGDQTSTPVDLSSLTSDHLVLHCEIDTSASRPLLFASADIQNNGICKVYYNNAITANACTGTITALCFDGTAKDSTCFNGCTYAQACSDIRNGLVTTANLASCGYTTCTGTISSISLNGCSFTVNNGVATLTGFKPSTAGTADNSLCFGGCTYSEACADIRTGLLSDICFDVYNGNNCVCTVNNNGCLCLGSNAFNSTAFCSHDCLVRFTALDTCADRNILFSAQTNGCICPVNFSCGVPITFNACTGRMNIGSSNNTGSLVTYGYISAQCYITQCKYIQCSFPYQSKTYVLIGCLKGDRNNEEQLGLFVCGSNIVNSGVLKVLQTNSNAFPQNNIEIKLSNYCNNAYGITGIGFVKTGSSWNCYTCVILEICNASSSTNLEWKVGLNQNQVCTFIPNITCLGSTAPTFDCFIEVPASNRNFYYNNARTCFDGLITADCIFTKCINSRAPSANQSCYLAFYARCCNATTLTTSCMCFISSVNGGILCVSRISNNGYYQKYQQTIDLSEGCVDCFYPVTWNSNQSYESDIEIRSPTGSASMAYNQNYIHFYERASGHSDMPRTLYVQTRVLYDTNENVFGCIGYGTTYSLCSVIWLRGGMNYVANANTVLTPHLEDWQNGNTNCCSIYTVGTSLCGGTNTCVGVFNNGTTYSGYKNGTQYFTSDVYGCFYNRDCCPYATQEWVTDKGYTTCVGTLTGVSLNGCAFTVDSNGVASLTNFKPATADNATCFNDCTYAQACSDIRSGLCSHDCLVVLCQLCSNTNRNILFSAQNAGCICPVYSSNGVPFQYNACCGCLRIGDFSCNCCEQIYIRCNCGLIHSGPKGSQTNGFVVYKENNSLDNCSIGVGIGSGNVNRGFFDYCKASETATSPTFRWLQYWDAEKEIHALPIWGELGANNKVVYSCVAPLPSGTRRYVLVCFDKANTCNPSNSSACFEVDIYTSKYYIWVDVASSAACMRTYWQNNGIAPNGNAYGSFCAALPDTTANGNCFWITYSAYKAPVIKSSRKVYVICNTTTAPSGITFTAPTNRNSYTNVYCGTTCLCTLQGPSNLCLGSLAFSSATIPTKISDLTDDSNFITGFDVYCGENCVCTVNKTSNLLCLNATAFTGNATKAVCVKQAATTSTSRRPLLLAYSSSPTSGSCCCVQYSTAITAQPSTGTLFATCFKGAIYDGDGCPYALACNIPTVNDSTIKIQKNSTDVGSFTLNQLTDCTIDILVPTKTSDLTNDSGYTSCTGTVVSVTLNGCAFGDTTPASGALSANIIPSLSYTSATRTLTTTLGNCTSLGITLPIGINCTGTLTSSDLTGYATENWVTNQGYTTCSGDTIWCASTKNADLPVMISNCTSGKQVGPSSCCSLTFNPHNGTLCANVICGTFNLWHSKYNGNQESTIGNQYYMYLGTICNSCADTCLKVDLHSICSGKDAGLYIKMFGKDACTGNISWQIDNNSSEDLIIPNIWYSSGSTRTSIYLEVLDACNADKIVMNICESGITCFDSGTGVRYLQDIYSGYSMSSILGKDTFGYTAFNKAYFNRADAQIFSTTSALKCKCDIEDYKESALDLLNKINIITYKYKNEEKEEPKHVGLIADYTPSVISGKDKDQMRHADVLGLLIKAVQELSDKIGDK